MTDCLWAEGIQYWECKPIYTFSSPSSDKLLCLQIGNQAREEAPLFQVSFKRPPKPRSSKYQPPLYKAVSRLLWLLGSCWVPCSAAQPGVMTGCFLSLHLPPRSSPPPVTSTSSTDLPLTCPAIPRTSVLLPSSLITAKAHQTPELHSPRAPLPLRLQNSSHLKADLPFCRFKVQILSTRALHDPGLLFLFCHILFPSSQLAPHIPTFGNHLSSDHCHAMLLYVLCLPYRLVHMLFRLPRTLFPQHFT